MEVKFVTIHGKAAYQALLMEVISVVWYVFRRIAGLGPQDRPQNMHPISHVEGVQIPVPGILLSTPKLFTHSGSFGPKDLHPKTNDTYGSYFSFWIFYLFCILYESGVNPCGLYPSEHVCKVLDPKGTPTPPPMSHVKGSKIPVAGNAMST